MRFIYSFLLSIFLIHFPFRTSFGEGTKEIYPVGGGFYKIALYPNDAIRNKFALYTATEPERLNITILNPNEVIFFGFNDGGSTNNFKFRIKDQAGTVVYTETQIPTTGQGFITSLAEARTGPKSIFGTGGYDPSRYIAPVAGTYYMEFTTGGNNKDFEYFDITVSNPDSTEAIYGRVWSKAWQCTTTGASVQCAAKFFAYSDDQIVTAVNFNGMRPYTFDISCNSTGCNNTGDFLEDRKSRPGRFLYPQYKLFLNNPDSLAFPTGVLGQIDSVKYTSYCNGTVDFKIWTNKDGSAEILLDIFAPAGYSPGDVKLPGQVLAGTTGNVFSWDGKDGNGIDVLNGTSFLVTTSYLNGLTHLPLYDSEYNFDYNPNWQGYTVTLIRPTGNQPALYWDDGYCGGGSNFTGCTNPTGCHAWGYNVGNEKTINTWWYAVSTSSVPITLLKKIDITYDSALSICNGDSVLIAGIYRKVQGDYTIFNTSLITGCDSNIMITLTIDPTPVVQLGADVWICDGFTHTFDAGAGAGYLYQWDNLTTGITNIGSNQTYTTGIEGFYKVTVTTNKGCHKSDSIHLFVNPKPHLTNTPFSDTICSTFPFNITLASNIPGTNFSWLASLVSGNITGFSNGSGSLINQVLTNNNPTSGKVRYTITPVAGGCFGNDTNFFVVVKPKPNVTTNPLNYQICSASMTTIPLTSAVAGATFTWTAAGSSGSVTGFSAGTGNNIQQTLTNSSFVNQTVTYKVVAHATGCNGDTTTFLVTVYPKPDLSNTPPSAQICDKTSPNVTLTSHVAGALFTWKATGTANVTGFSNNLTPTTLLNQNLINSSFTNGTVTYRILPWIGGCPGDSTSFIVTVYPTADLSNTPATKQICNNTSTSITLTSNVTGTLFTWTASGSSGQVSGFTDNLTPTVTLDQTLFNTGNIIETVTYHITPIANGCIGTIKDYIVKVAPVPDLKNNPAAKSQCNNTATNITLTSNVTGTLFTWTASGSSALVTGFSDNLAPTITLNQTLNNSGYNIETVTYHLIPHANGCDGPVTEYTVTVFPTPDLSNSPKNQQQCNDQLTNIALTSNVAGTQFTWTCVPSSGSVSGYANSITPGILINQTLHNSGYNIETVTYKITPRANNCDGALTNYLVTVYPTPDLSNSPKNKSQCNNQATNIPLTSNVAGTLFTWTCTPSSVNLSGFSDNATPSGLLDQTIVNSGFTIETVTYHITPRANNCDGPVTDYVVTVYPTADAYFQPPAQTICTGQTTNVDILSHVAGTSFTWTASATSPLVNGFLPGNGTNISHTIFSSSTLIETVTYVITPVANGCTGTPSSLMITVNPGPALTTSPLAQTICSAQAINIPLTSNVAGTAFSWTATPTSPNISGHLNGTGNTISQTLANSGYTIESVTYAITPSANGCTGAAVNYIVTINPVPDLSNNPKNQQQCNNQSTNLALNSNVSGTLFTWTCTPSSGNITGWSNSVAPGTAINQTLANASLFSETVTYHLTPHANGCDGPVTDYVVTVIFKPALTNSPLNKAICNNTSTNITLTANVSGTLFTWLAIGGSPSVTGYSDNTTNPMVTLNQTLTNSSNVPQTVTYRIVPHAVGCEGDTTNFVVTVQPTPNLTTLPLSKQQCNNLATNIPLLSNVAGTLFTWTCTPSSVNLSGFSDNATPSGLLNQTIVNSGFTIETVTYQITPRANNCDGPVTDYVVTVYPTADTYFQPSAQTICTGQTTNVDILSHVTGTSFTWTASATSPLVNGFLPGNGTNISHTIFSSSTLIETVTYVITPVANGCTGTPSSLMITVNPGPALTTSPLAQTICSAQSINIPLTSNVAGTAFSWTATPTSPNISGHLNGTGNTISQTLTNSGYTIESVTYAITPSANGCTGAAVNYIVTVNPVPDLSNSPKNQQQCNNQSTNLALTSNVLGTLFTWTCTPSSGNITGWSNSVAPGTAINQTLANASLFSETVTYHLTPHANGCDGPVTDYVVTVIFKPALTNSPLNKPICNNTSTNITLTANVSGTLFTWLAIGGSPSVTGYSDNTTNPMVILDQTLTNSSNVPQTVTYRIVPHAVGCEGDTTNFVVTVQPTPNLTTLPLNKQQCNNLATNIPLTSNVAGTLFTWTCTPSSVNLSGFSDNATPSGLLNQTIVNSGFTTETVTYHITPRAYNCDGPILDYVVTVFPTPDIYFQPLSLTLCDGQTTNIQNLSHVASPSFSWTASSSSLLVTGYSGGSGPLIQQTLINSGTTVETVTYVTTPVANGCTGPAQGFTVTVNPTPHVTTTPLNQTICTGSSISVNLTSSVTGSTFAWTCTASSPNLGGFAAGNGNLVGQTLTNSGYTIETVTYHITPTANGCDGPVSNYIVTVNPRPDLSNNPLSSQICSGTSPNISLLSNVAGTNFSWTATGSSPNITGYGPGSGTLINQVLTNLGLNTETVTYHVTPTANGCTGITVDYVVTIVSIPDVYFMPAAQTVCSQTDCNIQNLSHVVGTTFAWTVAASSGNITGYSAGSGNLIQQTLFNSGTTIETVTYTVAPAAFGCPPGIPQNVVVTVNPKPAVTNIARNSSICSAGSTSIIPQSTVTGSNYTWTASGSSLMVSGFTPGSGLMIQQVLTNAGYNIETVTYVVTPVANTCSGDTAHFTVTVFPVADAYFTPPAQAICPLQTCNININSNVAGSTFTWTATGSSLLVTGYSAGSGILIQQTLDNTGYSIETVTYLVSPTANGCAGSNSNVIVSVDPNPSVNFTPCWDPVTTTDAQPIKLKGASPLNGTFSGTGVVADQFYPAVAGVGTFPITYSYTNLYGCNANASQSITVVAPLAFSCGNALIDVRDNQQYATIQIGSQCWMAANLMYGSMISSTLMQRDNCIPEKYCYGDVSANCNANGGLYQWDEMMKFDNATGAQGFCPPGWHVPTESQWGTLFNYYISNGFAGSPLKYTGYSGFLAYLDGASFMNVNWNFNNFAIFYWSSTPRGSFKAWAHGMNTENPSVSYYPGSRTNAFSVRCVKD